MENTQNEFCKNCGQEFQDDYKFCPSCGQRTNDKLTFSELFYNTITNYFSFDAKFLKSIIPLLFRPGYLARRFVDGKRTRYLHPGNFYLFVSVIFFLLNSSAIDKASKEAGKSIKDKMNNEIINDKSVDSFKNVVDSIQIARIIEPLKKNKNILGLKDDDFKAIDSITSSTPKVNYDRGSFYFNGSQADSLLAIGASDEEIYAFMGMKEDAGFFKRKFYERQLQFHKNGQEALLVKLYDSIPAALFILLPIFAFFLKLFYFKRGPYTHHLVFSLYFFAFLFSIGILIIGVNKFIDVPDALDWLLFCSTFLYFIASLHYFYKSSWIGSFFKGSFVTFLYLVILVPIAGVFAIAYTLLFA